jgi:hypothetical protein
LDEKDMSNLIMDEIRADLKKKLTGKKIEN